MLGGQLSDVFDKLDRSPRVTNDPDYMLVVSAACAGFALLVVKRAMALSRRPLAQTNNRQPEPSVPTLFTLVPEVTVAGPSPPSLSPLRI